MTALEGRWFPDLTGDLPVRSAAFTVVQARSAAVRRAIKAVFDKHEEDPEHVHQLRVTARRLGAALSTFENLDPDVFRRAGRACAKLRRAVGEVRDADVLSEVWGRHSRGLNLPRGLVKSIRRGLDERRRAATSSLKRSIQKRSESFERKLSSLHQALMAPATTLISREATLGSLARGFLKNQLSEVLAPRNQEEDLNDADEVHQLRIAVKNLRYNIELFMGCFSREAVETSYRRIQHVQDELGAINDLRSLYTVVCDLRVSTLREGRPSNRKTDKMNFDQLTAQLAHDWFALQRAFVECWKATGRRQVEESCHRLLNELPICRRMEKVGLQPWSMATERA